MAQHVPGQDHVHAPAPSVVRRGTKGAQLQSGKYYNIRSYTTDRFLDVANGAARDGNEIIGWQHNGGINQFVSPSTLSLQWIDRLIVSKWRITELGRGIVAIQSAETLKESTPNKTVPPHGSGTLLDKGRYLTVASDSEVISC